MIVDTGDPANANVAAVVAMLSEQLASFEALAVEGRSTAGILRTEIARLSSELLGLQQQLVGLETSLQTQQQLIAGLRQGLQSVQPVASGPLHQNGGRQYQVAETARRIEAGPLAPDEPLKATPAAPPAPVTEPQPVEELPQLADAAAQVSVSPMPLPAPAEPGQATEPVQPVVAGVDQAPVVAPAPVEPAERPARRATATEARLQQPAERNATTSAPAARVVAPASTETAAPVEATPERAGEPPLVQRGSTVEVIFDDAAAVVETYTIVRPNEANAVQNLISENSPLGSALLGARIGDTRSYRVRPHGPEIRVRVRDIVD